MNERYDLVIIGGGAAGLTAASCAVQFGARVALVEKNRTGGDCTWSGCVPSKSLRQVAQIAHDMRTAAAFGLPATQPQVDLQAVMARVRSVVEDIYQDESPEALRADGIAVYLGRAQCLDPHTLQARENHLQARNILIATGARPSIPNLRGLEEVDYLTYETIWELRDLPPRLLVLGAGPVGCELAQAFQRLGSQVTLVAAGDQLLPRDDPAAAQALEEVFDREGIRVVKNARAELVWQDQQGVHVGANNSGLVGDALLLATGRRPVVDGLGLDKAGIDYSEAGIQVDRALRTSQSHIYAAGDCTGGYQFTHYAGWQAAMAARNALLPGTAQGVAEHVPWTTFTDPEVAHVGWTEAQARAELGDRVATCQWPLARVDRARTDGNTNGFIKLVHKTNGTLLGATIVAPRAGEMIHEWIVALEHGIKVSELSNNIHVYPTYSVAGMQAAAAIRVNQLLNGTTGRVVLALARLMR